MMVVVMARLMLMLPLQALCPADRCGPAIVILRLALNILQLASPALGRRFSWHIRSGILGGAIGVVSSPEALPRVVRQLGTRSHRAGNDAADSAAYAREHATKLALDARLSCRSRQLRLGTLYGLGQG